MTHGKLGRTRPTSKKRALAPRLKDFLTAPLPPAPAEFHGATDAAIGMFGNDQYGCCTIAGLANYRAIRAAVLKQPAPPSTTDAVVKQYLALSPNDEGLVEIDVLNKAKSGLELGGPTWMDAVWASVSSADIATRRSLIAIFGAVYLGVELPTDAQGQEIWTPTIGRGGAPGGWGGHCLLHAGYTPERQTDIGVMKATEDLVTWGGVKLCVPEWLEEYDDEAYVLLDADSAAVAGVDFEALTTYVNEVAEAA